MADDEDSRAAVMTSAMMKALSHPLRRRILKVFAKRDFARAADIAADLDVPANSVSFHLRVLADAGLISEAPDQARDRRDRVWKSDPLRLDLGTPEQPMADEVLGGALLVALAQDHTELLRRVVAWAPEFTAGRTTEIHGTFARSTVRMTEAQFEVLTKRLAEAIAEAQKAGESEGADSRVWEIDIVAADDRI